MRHPKMNTRRLGAALVILALVILALVIPALASGARAQDDDTPRTTLVALPGEVDLGPRLAGAVAETSVWLVNSGAEPITISAVKGSCGCIATPGFEPGVLEPLQAVELALEVTVALTPGAKSKTIKVTVEDQDYLVVPLRVEAVAEDDWPAVAAARPAPSASPVAGLAVASDVKGPLRALPVAIDLGDAAPGAILQSTIWLVNSGTTSVAIGKVASDCGCIAFAKFEPRTLAPRRAARIDIEMQAPRRPGPAKRRGVIVRAAGQDPFCVPVSIRAVDQEATTADAAVN